MEGGKERKTCTKEGEVREMAGKRRRSGSQISQEKTKTKRKGELAVGLKRKLHIPGQKTAVTDLTQRLSLTVPRSKAAAELRSAERETGKKKTAGLRWKGRKSSKKPESGKELRIEDLGRSRRPRLHSPKKQKSPFLPSPSRKYAQKYSFQTLPRSLSAPFSQSNTHGNAAFPASQSSVSLRLDIAPQRSVIVKETPSSPMLVAELDIALEARQSEEKLFQSLLREICGSEDCALALEMEKAYKELISGCYLPPQVLIHSEMLDLRPSSPPSHPEFAYFSEEKADFEGNSQKYAWEGASALQEKGKLLHFAADTITEELFSALLAEISPILTDLASTQPSNDPTEGWKVPTDSQSISIYVHFLLQISQNDLQTVLKPLQSDSKPAEIQPKWCKYREIKQIDISKYEELERYRDFEALERAPSSLYRVLLESHQIHDRLLFDSVNELLSHYIPNRRNTGNWKALAQQISSTMSGWNREKMGGIQTEALWAGQAGQRAGREAAEEWGQDWEALVAVEVAEEVLRDLAEETEGYLTAISRA